MTNELQRRRGQDIFDGSADPFTPISSQSLFWRARHLAASPALGALPLLFWLTEHIRPSISVTLGVADAVPHFALCQAIEKLGLEAMCFGIGPANDLPAIQNYNETHYGDFSLLSQAELELAPEILEDAEIDFLIVNRPATQALQDEIDRVWLPRMSDRAVVLFLQGGANLRGYVTRIARNEGQFNFDTEKGICLALRGARQPEPLSRLCQLRLGKPGYLAVRNVFARIGELHSKTHELDAPEQLHAQISGQLKSAQAEMADLRKALATARSATAPQTTGPVYSAPATSGTEAASEIDDLRASLRKSQQEMETRFEDIAILGGELKRLTSELEDTRKRATTHMRNLENTSRDTGGTITHQRAELDGNGRDLAVLRDILRETERERDEARQRVIDLESSSSWRVTSPLRRATLMVRRDRGRSD